MATNTSLGSYASPSISMNEGRWRITNSPLFNRATSGNTSLIFEKNGRQVEFSRKKRLVINLIGTSGSGKGTQGEKLAKRYGIPHFSLGDLYREALLGQSSLGSLIQYQVRIDAVYTVNELCLGIFAKRLSQSDCVNGFILDGFPRTQIQGTVLNGTFLSPHDIHIPIFLDVADEIVLSRLVNRWYCKPCNLQVREHDEVQKKGECPSCSGLLTKREDDRDVRKVEEKLRVFSEYREGILRSVEERDRVYTLVHSEDVGPNKIFERICDIVERTLDVQPPKESRQLRKISFVSRESVVAFGLIALFSAVIYSHFFRK